MTDSNRSDINSDSARPQIIEVEITETITRIAHLKVVSDSGRRITPEDLADQGFLDAIVDAADEVSVERDGGREGATVSIIDPDRAPNYRLSLDGDLDLDEIEATVS